MEQDQDQMKEINQEIDNISVFRKREIQQDQEDDDYLSKEQFYKLLSMLQCPICLEIIKEPVYAKICSHRFCKECIEKAIRVSKEKDCPLCRKEIGTKRLLRQDIGILDLTQTILGNVSQYNQQQQEKEKEYIEERYGTLKQTKKFGKFKPPPKLGKQASQTKSQNKDKDKGEALSSNSNLQEQQQEKTQEQEKEKEKQQEQLQPSATTTNTNTANKNTKKKDQSDSVDQKILNEILNDPETKSSKRRQRPEDYIELDYPVKRKVTRGSRKKEEEEQKEEEQEETNNNNQQTSTKVGNKKVQQKQSQKQSAKQIQQQQNDDQQSIKDEDDDDDDDDEILDQDKMKEEMEQRQLKLKQQQEQEQEQEQERLEKLKKEEEQDEQELKDEEQEEEEEDDDEGGIDEEDDLQQMAILRQIMENRPELLQQIETFIICRLIRLPSDNLTPILVNNVFKTSSNINTEAVQLMICEKLNLKPKHKAKIILWVKSKENIFQQLRSEQTLQDINEQQWKYKEDKEVYDSIDLLNSVLKQYNHPNNINNTKLPDGSQRTIYYSYQYQ